MIFAIAKREYLENMYSGRLAIAMVLCLILIPTCFFLMIRNYEKRLENYSTSFIKDELFAGNIAQYGDDRQDRQVPKPGFMKRPTPLSILALGVDGKIGGTALLKGRWLWLMFGRNQERNLLFALFSPFDFLYFNRAVMSLLALLLAIHSFVGEREEGTLSLVFSGPVKRSAAFAGKLLGGMSALTIPYLCGTTIGLLQVVFSPVVSLGSEDGLRVGLMILISLIYIAVFFTLGIIISTLCRASSTAMLLGLICWMLLGMVLPNAFSFAAKGIRPVPSTERISGQRYHTTEEILTAAQRVWHTGSTYEYGLPAHPEANYEVVRTSDKIDRAHLRKQKGHIELSQALTRAFPSAAFTYAFLGLARTSPADFLAYKSSLLRQKEEFISRRYMSIAEMERWLREEHTFQDLGIPAEIAEQYSIEEAKERLIGYLSWLNTKPNVTKETKITLHWAPVETGLAYRERALDASLKGIAWDIVALLLSALVLQSVAFITVSRYDVRSG